MEPRSLQNCLREGSIPSRLAMLWFVENIDMHESRWIVAASAETAKAIGRQQMPTTKGLSDWGTYVVSVPYISRVNLAAR